MSDSKLRPLFKGGPLFNYNSAAFSLCTDSVLLADFALSLRRNIKQFAELGCGSGAMSLLLSHSLPNAKAVLLDVSEKAIEAAGENFTLNSMDTRAEFILSDVSEVRNRLRSESFELVISNPPYFAPKSGRVSLDSERSLSRQGRPEILEDFFSAAAYLLKPKGSFCFVMRTERLAEVSSLLRYYKLEPKKLRLVHDKLKSKSKIFLMEAKKNAASGIDVLSPLILRNEDGSLSSEHLKIYRMEEKNEG